MCWLHQNTSQLKEKSINLHASVLAPLCAGIVCLWVWAEVCVFVYLTDRQGRANPVALACRRTHTNGGHKSVDADSDQHTKPRKKLVHSIQDN